jgi:endonuclease-3 related protein
VKPAGFRGVYAALLRRYGPQHWWPADTPFEVMVGAVLTQNTAWINVERAIANLKARDALTPEAILALPDAQLAQLIRPSGYFNVKARRLKDYCHFYLDAGGLDALKRQSTQRLRARLLAVRGIGPETCDDILLYAFARPVFVVDAYTRRLFTRLGLLGGDEDYEAIRARFEHALGHDAPLYNEYHALIVRHAKDICRTKPQCDECCLARGCPARRA